MNDDSQCCRDCPTRYNPAHGARFIRFHISAHGTQHSYKTILSTGSRLQHVTVILPHSFPNFASIIYTININSAIKEFQLNRTFLAYAPAIKMSEQTLNYSLIIAVLHVQNDTKLQPLQYCTASFILYETAEQTLDDDLTHAKQKVQSKTIVICKTAVCVMFTTT